MPPKPSEKRTRVSSSEEEISAHVLVDDAILKDIQKKLEKLDMLDKINNQLSTIKHDITNIKSNVTELEKGLNAVNDDVAEMKESMKRKADLKQLEDLEREVEDLRNRSRRNNLVFYNIPEKSTGDICVAFMQGFIASHMGLETLSGYVEIERAHQTPTQSNKNRKSSRPIHVAFLKYSDKTKILANAAVRLKDNPFPGNLIGIAANFAKDTQEHRKALIPFKKHLQKKLEKQECRVFIAYPSRLKYSDSKGKVITVRNEELKKMESEMEK